MAIGFAHNAHTLLALRFLLGVAEAGLFLGVVFYLTAGFRVGLPGPIVALMLANPHRVGCRDTAGSMVGPGWPRVPGLLVGDS